MWSPQFGDVAYMYIDGWGSVIGLIIIHGFLIGVILIAVTAYREKYHGYVIPSQRIPNDMEFEYYRTDDKSGTARVVGGDSESPITLSVLSSQWAGWDTEKYKWGLLTRRRTTYVKWTCSCGYGVKGDKRLAPKMNPELFQKQVIAEFERTHKHGD